MIQTFTDRIWFLQSTRMQNVISWQNYYLLSYDGFTLRVGLSPSLSVCATAKTYLWHFFLSLRDQKTVLNVADCLTAAVWPDLGNISPLWLILKV